MQIECLAIEELKIRHIVRIAHIAVLIKAF